MLSLFTYDDNNMNNMFRDLAEYENLNVKDMLLAHKTEEKSKKSTSKIEKIRAENNKNKEQKLIDDDKKRLEYYNQFKNIDENLIEELKFFKTSWGKERMKFKLLNLAVKNENTSSIIELFLQIIHSEPINDFETKLKRRIQKKMDKIDYKKYQFQYLYNRLPPLDFYNDYQKKLDDWQIKVLKLIDQNKNIIVCARTSMGKTWLSMYPALIGKKTLFIVPTKPLAYQVCSVFKKFLNGKTSIIVKDYFQKSNEEIVLVGTPREIEQKLPNIKNDFDLIVCDEVHNLNNYDGDCYERLIKLFSHRSSILALSATIGNSHELKQWFESISEKTFSLIQHSTRFLNHQRYIWNDKLELIHPFSCLTFDDITDEFLSSNLPLTPKDNIEIFDSLKKEIGEQETNKIKVKEIFPSDNQRLSLDDSKQYEDILKKKIIELKKTKPEALKTIINKFYKNISYDEDLNIYSLFKNIKKFNLTPCILFQLNSEYCKEIFEKVIYYFESLEEKSYPYYYNNLEYLHEYYITYTNKYKKMVSGIKLGRDEGEEKKERIIKEYEENELTSFQHNFTNKVNKQMKNISKSNDITEKVKNIQLKNLSLQLNKVLKSNIIKDYDRFEKHPDFCMNTNEPMTAQEIRTIKKQIEYNLGINVEYTNVFMQGLKSGIGIYTEDMPEIYNQIVQSLAQNKQLGIVISDKTLGLGINMGFRSTCIYGYKDSKIFGKNDYEQLIGRAGRRGQDTEGNIIYCNVDWKILMRGELGIVTGKTNILYDYNVLTTISDYKIENTNKIYKNFLNSEINFQIENIQETFYIDKIDNKLLWNLKEYKNRTHILIKNLDKIEMIYKSDTINKNLLYDFKKIIIYIFKELNDSTCKEIEISKNIELIIYSEYFKQLQKGKFNTENYIKLTYEIMYIIQIIHNTIIECRFYKNTTQLLQMSFINMKNIININQSLNN